MCNRDEENQLLLAQAAELVPGFTELMAISDRAERIYAQAEKYMYGAPESYVSDSTSPNSDDAKNRGKRLDRWRRV